MSWWDDVIKGVEDIAFLNLPSAVGQGVITATDIADKSINQWFKSVGGQIGAGMESGFVSLFKDLWVVIAGPVLIGVGAILIIMALGIAFKNDLLAIAQLGSKVIPV